MRCEIFPRRTFWCSTSTRARSAGASAKIRVTRSTSLSGRWPLTAMSLRFGVIDGNDTPWLVSTVAITAPGTSRVGVRFSPNQRRNFT